MNTLSRRARRGPAGGWLARAAILAAAGAVCLPAVRASPLAAQRTSDSTRDSLASSWNSPAAVAAARRAIEAREYSYVDSSLRSFQADAQGHIYFIGEFEGEREVIRADQVALDIRWQAPDRALQTLIGRRFEIRLPNSVRYHVDHLSLVLDNFGDRIRLGDGDEVWNVLHPAAPGALDFYDFRVADSLEIRIRDRTTRVLELDVRPKDARDPAVVGSVFVDRASGAIARMRFTFTRASYRDPDLVQILLDLRSALFEDRYWLPAEQDLEITRSLSWLSFPIQTVIRTRIKVLEYTLNDQPSFRLSAGQYVASRPTSQLEEYDGWRAPLYGGPLEAGDRSDEDLDRAMRDARRLIGQQRLLGGERLQLSLPNASSGLRARRSEGLLVGFGGAYRIDDRTPVTFWGGYPTRMERPEARVTVEREFGAWTAGLEGRLRMAADVGFPVASGVVQTLGLVTDGEDYSDPFFEDGGRVSAARAVGGGRIELGASVLRQRRADLVLQTIPLGGGLLRPVRPIDEGELVAIDGTLQLGLGSALGANLWSELQTEAASAGPGSFGFTRATLRLGAEHETADSSWDWSSELLLGIAGGDLPAQRLFLLGGRGTLPGHAFRPWGGDRVALWQAEVSRGVFTPWVRVRVSGAAGWTDLGTVGSGGAARFGVLETPGIRGSAGLGVGLFYDLLRLDLARGLGSGPAGKRGDWVLLLSLDPFLWGVL